jgi:hypothetical protein
MKQRSAMLVAAGLVLALAVAGFGLAIGMTGPSADASAPRHHRKPIVHTVTHTVTVHKPASEGSSAPAGTVVTTSANTAMLSSGSDDSFEHETESDDDDAFEGGESGDD